MKNWELLAGSEREPELIKAELRYASGRGASSLAKDTLAVYAAQALTEMEWRPDVIHAQSVFPNGSFSLALANELGVPLVVTEHQHIIYDYVSSAEWNVALQVFNSAAKVAAVSEFLAQMLMMNGLQTRPIITGNLVDDRFFSPSELKRTLNTIVIIASASRLKDMETFFQALKIIRTTRPGVKVRILGGVQNQPLEGVSFTPNAGRAEVRAALHEADVLVSSSLAETFGVAVCEALMCGVPVVATKSGGVSDLVIDGLNGFLVRFASPDELAAATLRVLSGDIVASKCEIRDTVVDRFGSEAFLESMSRLYL